MDTTELEFYREHGYLIVRQALHGAELAALRAEAEVIQELVESGTWRGNHLMEDEGLARVIFNPFDFSPTFRHLATRDDMVARAKGMLGGSIHMHHSKLMCKVARKGTPQPPHQDYHYWQGDKPNQVACFLCIDPSTEANGCLRVFPGTQKLGLLKHHEEYHEITGERHFVCEVPPDAEEVAFIAEPGDAIFFGSLTIHRSDGNTSDQSRRGIIFEYDELGNLGPSMGWGAPEPAVTFA